MVARAAGVRDRRDDHECAGRPGELARFTKQAGNHGGTGYPQVRLLALVACGTRTLIDAVFGSTTKGETTYAPGLLRSLRGRDDHAGRPELRRQARWPPRSPAPGRSS